MIFIALEHDFFWCFGNDHLELYVALLDGIRVGGNADSPSPVVLHRGVFQFNPVSVLLLRYIAWCGSV